MPNELPEIAITPATEDLRAPYTAPSLSLLSSLHTAGGIGIQNDGNISAISSGSNPV